MLLIRLDLPELEPPNTIKILFIIYLYFSANSRIIPIGIINSLLKNPIFVILSEAKDLISVGDSSAFGLRMTQLGLFQQTVNPETYSNL
jgi:hypothetical protein